MCCLVAVLIVFFPPPCLLLLFLFITHSFVVKNGKSSSAVRLERMTFSFPFGCCVVEGGS